MSLRRLVTLVTGTWRAISFQVFSRLNELTRNGSTSFDLDQKELIFNNAIYTHGDGPGDPDLSPILSAGSDEKELTFNIAIYTHGDPELELSSILSADSDEKELTFNNAIYTHGDLELGLSSILAAEH